MTWTQTTVTIKDASGTNQPVIAYTDGTNFSFAHPLLDNTGAIVSPATQGTLASVLSALQTAIPAGSNVIGKFGIDQTAPGVTNLVQLPVPYIVAGNTMTRSTNTTAYGAGQLVNAATVVYPTIAAARGNDVAGTILRLRLKKSGSTLTNGIFRVHLYNAQPTATNADGGAWLTTTSGYTGSFDVTMTQAFSDSAMGIGIPTAGAGVAFAPATGTQNLYYLIESRAAYTPILAEVFTPYVEVQ